MSQSKFFLSSILLGSFLVLSGSTCGGSSGSIELHIAPASLQGLLHVKNEDISKATLQIRDKEDKIGYEIDITDRLKSKQAANPNDAISIDFSQIKDFDVKKTYNFVSIIEGAASAKNGNMLIYGRKIENGEKFTFKTEQVIGGAESVIQFELGVLYTFKFMASMRESFSIKGAKVDVYLSINSFTTRRSN